MKNHPCIRIGHLKIVDHLIIGIFDLLLKREDVSLPDIQLETIPMTAWSQVSDCLVSGEIDGAFLPAPIAMHLFAQGLDIKILMFAHRAGSIIVKSTASPLKNLADFKDKTILVSSELSIQTMLLHRMFSSAGLRFSGFDKNLADVTYEVVPPFLMTDMLSHDHDHDIAGYAVAEPFASKGIQEGLAKKICTTASLWKAHPCCVFVLKREVIENYSCAVTSILESFIQTADQLSRPDNERIMNMAGIFLEMETRSVRRMIEQTCICFDPELLIPDLAAFEMIQNYMADTMQILEKKIHLSDLVDHTFISKLLVGH